MTFPAQPETETTASAERRLVTVLFADVVDSTSLAERMDPEDWSGAIRSVLSLMSAPVKRYGGTVASLMGDGLLAVFGAPAAHEDDAIRAVQAGLEMIDAVAEAGPRLRREFGEELHDGPKVRVGINTGLAIVEGMGDAARAVDALGDTVNVAARMQGAARPGTVIVTGETWRHAGPAFLATSLGRVVVKGKAVPVDGWEIIGRADSPGTGRGLAGLTSPMVGRDDELAQLLSLVTTIRAGRGRAAVLLGEPGVGKSRLLAEARAAAIHGGGDGTNTGELAWIEARCVSYGENVPFGLVGNLILACLSLPTSGSPEERRIALDERAHETFGEGWEEALASLTHLLSLPLQPEVAGRFAPMSPQALRVRYLRAVEQMIRAVGSRGPAVIVLEDAHWADASSVELVSQLLPIAHELALLFLLTSRPERSAVGWQLVESARETFGDALAEIRLIPLEDSDSRLLIGNLLEIESLPEHLRASILERAEGNPFFTEELIRMLIERGWVVRSGDKWVGSGTVAEAEVPDTLRGLLLARIDRLPEEARRTLRMASVIGRDVPVRLLESITGDPAATARALGLAEASGLVRFVAVSSESTYRFRHVLIQEAAYDSLLKADRRRLHRRVGEALEAEGGGERREELAPLLGLHFERAGDVDRGVHYLQLAGRHALRARAVKEARELLDHAAALLDGVPETPESERLRIEIAIDRAAANATYPKEEDFEIIADARARAERLGDDRLVGLVYSREAGSRAMLELLRKASHQQVVIDKALEIGHRLNDPEILALPSALDGIRLMREGRRREAIPVLAEAVNALEKYVVNEASFYAGQLGIAYSELGEFETAATIMARARELAERSADPKALADIDIFEGIFLGLQGRHEEAATLAKRGAATAEAAGELLCQTMGSWVAGENELAAERLGPAIEWLQEANDLAITCRAQEVVRMTSVTLKAARALGGEGLPALVGLDLLVDETREAGDPLEEATVLLRRAQANAMLPSGDRASAKRDVEAAIAILTKLETRPYLEAAEQLRAMVSEAPPRPR
jgi:class 3 adenylate cyclase/tetratricopeptide (TPR) repeat protein